MRGYGLSGLGIRGRVRFRVGAVVMIRSRFSVRVRRCVGTVSLTRREEEGESKMILRVYE